MLRVLLLHWAWRAFSRAWANTGNRIAAIMAMMLITTSNSISVKADRHRLGNIIHRLLARLCLNGSKIMGVAVKGVKRG
jgi:hypothetical protein